LLDESFLDKFRVEHKDFETLMEDWFVDEEWSSKGRGNIYSHTVPKGSIHNPECDDLQALWRGNQHSFQDGMVLMAYTVAKTGKYFNWANILSFNIINRAREAQGMKNPGFYMTTYLD
jgi:hypothetical protein